MPSKDGSRFDAIARSFFSRFGSPAEAFFIRYLLGVRWQEFFTVTSGVFTAAIGFGETMRFPLRLTLIFAYVVATIFALGYLRIPKSDTKSTTAEARPSSEDTDAQQ